MLQTTDHDARRDSDVIREAADALVRPQPAQFRGLAGRDEDITGEPVRFIFAWVIRG
ncbi:MAG TPA: hypothetical protein VGG75_28020 [Trebonia sp.]